MSLTKRILFGSDPAYDEIRRVMSEAAARRIAEFSQPIPARRKNHTGSGPYWDPFWASAVLSAANELGIETILVNSKYYTRTKEQADAIRMRAEAMLNGRITDRKRRLRK